MIRNMRQILEDGVMDKIASEPEDVASIVEISSKEKYYFGPGL